MKLGDDKLANYQNLADDMARKLEDIRDKHNIDEKMAAERDNMEDDSEDED